MVLAQTLRRRHSRWLLAHSGDCAYSTATLTESGSNPPAMSVALMRSQRRSSDTSASFSAYALSHSGVPGACRLLAVTLAMCSGDLRLPRIAAARLAFDSGDQRGVFIDCSFRDNYWPEQSIDESARVRYTSLRSALTCALIVAEWTRRLQLRSGTITNGADKHRNVYQQWTLACSPERAVFGVETPFSNGLSLRFHGRTKGTAHFRARKLVQRASVLDTVRSREPARHSGAHRPSMPARSVNGDTLGQPCA